MTLGISGLGRQRQTEVEKLVESMPLASLIGWAGCNVNGGIMDEWVALLLQSFRTGALNQACALCLE